MSNPLTFGSLFAGIGGFDLGFERAGMVCKWQVEIGDFPRQVLEKHWPNVKRHDDVRTFPSEPATEWSVDLICGGFPCQDISNAGYREGIDGQRSGLWREFSRIIRVLRPRFVVVENVAALLERGIERVLGDLAAGGFDAEWDCLPASAFGAYSERDRVWIVAYDKSLNFHSRHLLDTSRDGTAQIQLGRLHRMAVAARGQQENLRLESEPRLDRLVGRVPDRSHRLEAVGNSAYPAVAEWIGRRIVEAVTP